MKIEIVTPNEVVINKEIDHFIVHKKSDQYAIFKGHTAIISVIDKGYIKLIFKDNTEEFIKVDNAIVEFKKDSANVMSQIAIKGDTLENSESEYNKYMANIKTNNKQRNVDYTKIEKDLHQNIKKAKAGKL